MDFQLSRRNFLLGTAAMGSLAAFGGLTAGTASAEPTGRIVIGRPTDSDNLDPVTCIGNQNIFIFNLILEGLVQTSDDGATIECCLAESYEMNEDGTVITFKVKEGLVFSDGTPVTAADWQFTFDRAMEITDSHWYMCVENIDHVECPDDTTVIVTMKQAAASTMANLCIFELGVQSKAYFESVGAEEYMNKIIGTGAFQIKEWKKGEYLTLEANPNYRNPEEPLCQEVEFKIVAEDASRVIQLQSGDIDIATDVPFESLSQLEGSADVLPSPNPATMTYWVSLNTQNEFLSNPKCREAIRLVTDPQMIVDMVTYGYATVAGSIVSAASDYCNKDIVPPAGDIEAAKACLAEAGYPDGFTIRMLMRGGNATYENIGQILQMQWAQIGINLEIDSRESTAYSEARKALDLDCVISGWSDDVMDPSSLMQFVFDYDVTHGYYSGMEQGPEMQDLNNAALVEIDIEKRKELYAQIQQSLILEQFLYVPIMSLPWQNAVRADVSGFVQTPLGNFRFNQLTK